MINSVFGHKILAPVLMVLVLVSYVVGRNDGSARCELNAARQSLRDAQERVGLDAEVNNLDAAQRCIELGGMPEQCREQVQRVNPSAKN